jgi:putative endopeptidase
MRLLNCSLLFVAITCSPLLFSQNSLHGIDVTDLDRKADPCNDFFQFSNGTWRANNPIPASMTRWSKRWASGEMNKDSLKEIAEHAAQGQDLTTGSTRQIVGDYYGACMDETRVNERGIAPLSNLPEFQKAFSCQADAAMVRPPEKRCDVW